MLTVVVVATLCALSLWRITLLDLNTDFSELLPSNDPAVIALHRMDRRMAALSSLMVVVQGSDPAANRRLVDELVPRLRALRDPIFDDVEHSITPAAQFFERNKYLYASLEDLVSARRRLEREIASRKNPLLVDFEGEEGKTSAELERALKRKNEAIDKFPDGYYARKDRQLYVIVVWLRSSFLGQGGVTAARLVKQTAQEVLARHPGEDLKVGFTGNVINAEEERDALVNDLTLATTVSVVLIFLAVFLFYGRWWSVPLAMMPAFAGVLLALGFAQLAFGYLNMATSFLGAIIVGNGVNFAIIQMARYEEERRAGRGVVEACLRSVENTWKATGLAALAASISYGSLAITDFRGFNQFGYIGGVGMLVAWSMTLTLLPALLVLFDRRAIEQVVGRVRGWAIAAPLARLISRRPGAIILGATVLVVAAVLPLPRYFRDPFEYDFNKLRNQVSITAESEVLSGKLDPIFGRSLSPSFVLVDRPGQAEPAARVIRDHDRQTRVIGEVRTVYDLLPGSPAEQQQKLRVLSEIRTLVDRNLRLLDGKERAEVERYRPPPDLAALEPRDLPRQLRRFFTEADGTIGRVVIYFPRQDVNVWDGRVNIKLARAVRTLNLPDGSTIHSSGWAVIFAAMIEAIERDGPILTLASLAGVLLLALLLVRGRGAVLIVVTVVVGVLWTVAGMALWGTRINFLNFIALPITFGIGADYAVNVYARYRLEGPGAMERAVRSSGAAVALCSLTTIIGYGSLLVADNRALRSFGAIAIVGEFACLAAALLLLSAVIEWLDQRRARTSR